MADLTRTLEGFSLSHAAVLDGSTGAEEVDGDIYGVRSGTIAADTGNFDNTGDDRTLSSWFWFNFATVTVEAGYIPLKLYALLSTVTETARDDFITEDGSGEAARWQAPLWNESSLNTPARPLLIRVPSRDADGNVRTLDIVLYKVQFGQINFTGPTYKGGLVVNYVGRALMSNRDEAGNTLAEAAVGRLVATAPNWAPAP